MSPIGKIFVVVNLALAAAFLGWASNVVATGQDYKTQLEDAQASHETEKQELEDQLDQARTELNTLRQDKEQIADARDDQKARADRAEAEAQQLASENSQLRGDLTAIRSSLDDYNDQLESVNARAEAANEARLEAVRERNDALQEKQDAQLALREAKDRAQQAATRADDLESELADARERVQNLEALRDTIVARYDIQISDVMAQPDIDGAVVSVKREPAPGLVSINKGSEDGVLRGTTFDIFRDGTYKGRVRVTFVHPTWSSAVIVRSESGAAIEQGDRASTNL